MLPGTSPRMLLEKNKLQPKMRPDFSRELLEKKPNYKFASPVGTIETQAQSRQKAQESRVSTPK